MQAISVSEARQNFKKYCDDVVELDESYKQLDEGKVVVKTLEELEAMEDE